MITPVRSYWINTENGPFHMHILAPIDDPDPKRTFGVFLVTAESNSPVRSANVRADWGVNYGYQDKVTDHRGFVEFSMPIFYGPMRNAISASFDLQVNDQDASYHVATIGEKIVIAIPRSIWGKGKPPQRPSLPLDSWRHVRHPCD